MRSKGIKLARPYSSVKSFGEILEPVLKSFECYLLKAITTEKNESGY